MDKLRILFVGTGEFAVPILQKLMSAEVELVGIVTQPDKPVGRAQQLEGGPVKQYLESLPTFPLIPIFQPHKLRLESQAILQQTQPDLVIVAAYGQMIPDDMLQQPTLGAINLHGSLLPHLRGAVPVPMAILEGLNETGVTMQKMVKALDAGAIYAVQTTAILPNDTAESLKLRLAELGAELLVQTLPKLAAGQLMAQPQAEAQATFCYQADIAKDKAEIEFTTPVKLAERMVRAFYPWPIAWFAQGTEAKRIKIYSATIATSQFTAGDQLEVVRMGKRLFLLLQDGSLELQEIQLESKTRRPASEYLFLASRSVAPAD